MIEPVCRLNRLNSRLAMTPLRACVCFCVCTRACSHMHANNRVQVHASRSIESTQYLIYPNNGHFPLSPVRDARDACPVVPVGRAALARSGVAEPSFPLFVDASLWRPLLCGKHHAGRFDYNMHMIEVRSIIDYFIAARRRRERTHACTHRFIEPPGGGGGGGVGCVGRVEQ